MRQPPAPPFLFPGSPQRPNTGGGGSPALVPQGGAVAQGLYAKGLAASIGDEDTPTLAAVARQFAEATRELDAVSATIQEAAARGRLTRTAWAAYQAWLAVLRDYKRKFWIELDRNQDAREAAARRLGISPQRMMDQVATTLPVARVDEAALVGLTGLEIAAICVAVAAVSAAVIVTAVSTRDMYRERVARQRVLDQIRAVQGGDPTAPVDPAVLRQITEGERQRERDRAKEKGPMDTLVTGAIILGGIVVAATVLPQVMPKRATA